jgi:hypothetical protein
VLSSGAELSYLAGVSDLASEPLGAGGRSPEEPLTQGPPSLKERKVSWRGWSGGVAMLVALLAPQALLVVRRSGGLIFHFGTNFTWDAAGTLSTLPAIAAFGLLAPLVGYRRRDALLIAIPIYNVYVAWVAGARAVQLRPGDTPQRWAGSRDGTAVAVLMECLAGAAYLTWFVVSLVVASP